MLLALSFPRFGHPAFAWIALVPLLVALSGWRGRPGQLPGQRPLRAFTLGLVTGLVYFVGTVYWTSTVIATFGQVPLALSIVAMLLLATYLALYPAIAALIVSRLIARYGVVALLVTPAAWVATEYMRGYLFGGFPWVPLGNSQVTVLPVAQLASVFGVYGLSALVAFVSGAIAFALVTEGRSRSAVLATAAVLLVSLAGWGTWRIRDGSLTRRGAPVKIGLVQGNIEQTAKWDPAEARRIFTTYIAMTRDVARRGADVILWPESSTPFTFERDPVGQQILRDLVREVRRPLLFGSDQPLPGDRPGQYNAAFLVAPDGRTAAVYRKIHLVPFGEYVPMGEWLSFFPPLVQTLAGFSPFVAGDSVVMLPIGDHMASTAICYEVVYPSLVREAVLGGSELLTTITNDAWYGQSSAPHQHFAMASMRAIEHGRYLARAANTGISGVVDPYGRVVERSALFEQAGLVVDARFVNSRTVYTTIGDLVAYASMGIVVLALIGGRSRNLV